MINEKRFTSDLPISCMTETPPPRLTEQEVLQLSGLAKKTLDTWKQQNRFPKPLYRTRLYGNIYRGREVYVALGFIVDNEDDPFYESIDG